MVDARTDGLDQEPHRLAADFDETLYAQHVLLLGGGGDAPGEIVGIADRRDVDDEGIEVVMLVVEFIVVMRLAVLDVVLDGEAEAEQQRCVDLAVR